ncbi:hypothetical protein DFJ74DRAFT_673029 [Hyaloraphidium curvatum]|nr:hypothetical protein DFJ74DRAFT_673029 [Hyaloraphidium curvatum]
MPSGDAALPEGGPELYPSTNTRVIFAERPKDKLTLASFRTETVPFDWKAAKLEKGDVLVRNLLISIDPSMRFHMEAHPGGFTYIPSLEVGEAVHARAVAVVLRSEREGVKPGEIIWAGGGWEDYSILREGKEMMWKLPVEDTADLPLSYHLGVLGMPGMTAWAGLFEIGRPKEGQTVLVNAAAGAVGQAAVQMAKLCGKDLRVIATAGGDKKVEFLKKIGADVAFDYKTALPKDRTEAEKKIHDIAGEKGIDIFFDNVGGEMMDTVITSLKQNGVVIQCGWVGGYDREGSAGGQFTGFRNLPSLIVMRLRIEGFVVFDYFAPHPMQKPFWENVPKWLREKKMVYAEDIRQGLESAPQAMVDILAGKNFGKTIIQVVKDKTFGKFKLVE